jgi:hypothetical protein
MVDTVRSAGPASAQRNSGSPRPANRAGCRSCGDVIESKHRHDFVTCRCGDISVDGGEEYMRRSFRDHWPVELRSQESLAEFLAKYTPPVDATVRATIVAHDKCGTADCCGIC